MRCLTMAVSNDNQMTTNEINTKEVQQIAAEFARILKNWLTAEEWARLVAQDKVSEYSNANEYCDANQAMIDAFASIVGREMRFAGDVDDGVATFAEVDADHDLIEAVWAVAKKSWTA